MAAGLLLVTAVDLHLLLDGLPVSDLGGPKLGLYVVFGLQLGAQHIQMDVAHAGNDHFLGLAAVAEGEGAILFVQLGEAVGNLIFLTLDLGIDRQGVAGLFVGDGGQGYHLAGSAQGVASANIGQLAHHADVAAADLGGVQILLALGQEDAAQLFIAAGAGIGEGEVGGDVAGEHLEEGVLAVLIDEGLKHEEHGRAILVQRLLAALCSGHGLALQGVGRKLHQIVQQVQGAKAGHGAAAEHGEQGAVVDGGPDAGVQLLRREGLFHEELLHKLLTGLCHGLVEGVLIQLQMIGGVPG